MASDGALVRPVRPGDREAWRRLWSGYHAHGRSGDTDPPAAVTEATWARFFHGNEPMEALLAERDGHPVGFVHLVFHPVTGSVGPVCRLNDLFVAPAWRGQGIGRALVKAAAARAAEGGAGRLYWHVRAENAAARRLYDRVAVASGHLVYARAL